MFKSVRIITRQNKNSLFFHEASPPSKERQAFYYNKYVKTGKSIGFDVILSDDGLTVRLINKWASRDAYLEFCTDTDPILIEWAESMNRYIEEQGFIDCFVYEDSDAVNFYNLPHIFVVFRPGAAGNFLSSLIENLEYKQLNKMSLSTGGHAHYNSIVERKKLGIDHISLGIGLTGMDPHFFTEDDKINYYKEKIDGISYENKNYVTWTHDFTNIPLYKKIFPNGKILVIKEDTLRERLTSMIMAVNKNHFSKDQQIPIPVADHIKPELYKKTFISSNFSKYYPNSLYKQGHIDLDKHIMYQSHLFCHGLASYDKNLLDSPIDYLDNNSNKNLKFIERRAQHSVGFNFAEFADEYVNLKDILSANSNCIIPSIEKILGKELTADEKEYVAQSLSNYRESQDQKLLEDPFEYLNLAKEKADNIVSAF